MRTNASRRQLYGDLGGKFAAIRRKRDVICVTRIRTASRRCQFDQTHVEHVPDEIRNDRRAGTTLWERVVVTRDLRNDRGNALMQREIPVLNEEAADAAEVDRREKVFQVDVEDIAAMAVPAGVRDD